MAFFLHRPRGAAGTGKDDTMSDKTISRRAMLLRMGLLAGAVYAAPSVTTLGVARASGASAASAPSGRGRGSAPSGRGRGRGRSGRGRASRASRPSR
jgi:hypothetical protein